MKLRNIHISIVAIIVFITVPVVKYVAYQREYLRQHGHDYVTSLYSPFCYRNGMEPRTMKPENKMYYVSLDNCGKELKSSLINIVAFPKNFEPK